MRTPDCHPDRKHRAHGMCDRCYQWAWRHGTPSVPPQPAHCFGCGRETDETALTEMSLIKRPVVSHGRHYVSFGRIDICPRCLRTVKPPVRRLSKLRVVVAA